MYLLSAYLIAMEEGAESQFNEVLIYEQYQASFYFDLFLLIYYLLMMSLLNLLVYLLTYHYSKLN